MVPTKSKMPIIASTLAAVTAGKAVVAAQRDEVGLDQPVGAAAADEEGREQHPEQRHPRRIAQHLDRRHQQRQQARRRRAAAA